ncbi:hypothetical protein J5N97_024150 [Dioscorea zingiberensis]|uniref:SOSEKI DIX-like domain-containing protein n=1 Tax=Dioscorea zingiberensis TaxID=325984 RepID=A0A9D5H8K4_9LILI|nr:hypothetical protein J5N97_024150 [Dioscorea zingiberensis]
MDARTMRKYASPERARPWTEPFRLLPGKKIPVVYYLCRNRHLEHPHFMEVPLSSSDGLYLRDVIDRLNSLRGRGMAAMYSWSCKRSYKNGFVWHDLLEDDLVVPAHGNEYVLKGSELLDRSPRPAPSPPSSSSSPPTVVIKEAKSPPSEVELGACKPNGAQDAATQTENGGAMDLHSGENHQNRVLKPKPSSEIEREEVSPPPASTSSSGGKTQTLESLIRAEARLNGFRFMEEDQVLVSARTRLKATNVFMHLITCGSISVKDHHNFGLVQNYKPKFSHAKFSSPLELDCFSNNPRLIVSRIEDKEYFSGSFIETKRHMEGAGEGVPTLKRSSSYNADRCCKSTDSRKEQEKVGDSSHSKCLPRAIKITSNKQSRNDTMRSPISDVTGMSTAVLDCGKASPNCSSKGGSRRITDSSSLKGSSRSLESFREDKEKILVSIFLNALKRTSQCLPAKKGNFESLSGLLVLAQITPMPIDEGSG